MLLVVSDCCLAIEISKAIENSGNEDCVVMLMVLSGEAVLT